MRTEWRDPGDRTACSRVPGLHDWRRSMPYTGPDGVRRTLWLCAVCLAAMPGLPAPARRRA